MTERDLQTILDTLSITRRPGSFCFVDLGEVPAGAVVQATVVEAEGTTAVVDRDVLGRDTRTTELLTAWLTIEANSALDLVGLTAAVSGALAEEGIACNVLAGRHHDHLLVPVADVRRAIAVLENLRTP